MSDKPNLDDSQWRMFPFAIYGEGDHEMMRDFVEAEVGDQDSKIENQAIEAFREELHMMYGDDDGKRIGSLFSAKKLIIGDPITYEQHAQPMGPAKLEGREVEMDEGSLEIDRAYEIVKDQRLGL